jgi:hypothetical protein
MEKDTTVKKVWQKPEVSDLDVSSTSVKPSNLYEEGSVGPSGS